MKIVGTGVDIVENSRIKKSILNNSFLNRVFTNEEILISEKMKNKSSYFAKRFAAKEAFVKAIGTGFTNKIKFNEIEISNDSLGKPLISIKGKTKNIIQNKLKLKRYKIIQNYKNEFEKLY